MRYTFLAFFLVFHTLLYAQTQQKADSLLRLVPSSADTVKVQLLIKVANLYLYEDTTKFRTYLQQGEQIAVQKQLTRWEAKCKQRFASYLYNVRGEHITAIKHYQNTVKLFEKTKNSALDIASCYYFISYIYRVVGDDVNAMQYALKILQMPEVQKDTHTLARGYDLVGQVYYSQQNYEQALKNKLKSLGLYKQTKDDKGIATSLNNLATVYIGMKDYEKAIKTNLEAIDLHAKIGDSIGMTYPIHNIGDAYLNMKAYKKAIPYFQLSMRVYGQSGSTLDAAMDYTKLGACYVGIGEADKAEAYIKKGLALAQHNNETNSIIDSYNVLSDIDSMRGNFARAMQYHKKAVALEDSLDTNERTEQINRIKTIYDVDKKDAENLLLKKDQELSEKTIRQQYFIILGAVVGFLLCVGLAFVLYRANKQSKAANRLLQEQQEQIEQQNEELRQQNEEIQAILELVSLQKDSIQNQHKEITDSINYAQKIQQAILPFANRFDKAFGATNYFILYKPRNIVSGDFYWLYETEDTNKPKLTTLIVSDCTGHGVPGAFMSMIGTQLLQEIVIQKNVTSPEKILQTLQTEINYALQQKESNSHDGMDISILVLNKAEGKAYYSGAMNPIMYIQNNELLEIKGDKTPIGGVQLEEERHYTCKTIDISIATTFYMFSDGYQDQFGGIKNKKFTIKALRELLLTNHQTTMENQHTVLKDSIESWIELAKESQTDDITLIGIRV